MVVAENERAETLPLKVLLVPMNILLFASRGTTVGSMARVPLVVIGFGPAIRPWPGVAVTLVTVPLPPLPPPGNVCPLANVMIPLPATDIPDAPPTFKAVVALLRIVVPFTLKLPGFDELPKKLTDG